jgi:hypothetical protein
MDAIVIRCKMCKHAMKFSAEKAGKRAKCPKCDAIILIQAEPEKKKAEPEAPPETPAPAPAASTPPEQEEVGEYGVNIDPELEALAKQRAAEEEAKRTAKKERKKLPKVARKIKAIPDAESWQKVRVGMLFVFAGVWVWLFCHLVQGSYVLLGSVDVPEYAILLGDNLEERRDVDFPPIGHGWDIDELGVYLGWIAGRSFLGYASGCLVISSVFYFVQAGLWVIGYFFCLPVPRRFGMFGQILAALGLAAFNMLVMFIFKFLAVVGAHGYIMIPFLVPEVVLTEYNMERMVPIHILWSGAPFWENLGCLIFRSASYLEPALFCIFIWSAGVIIKDKTVEEGGKGRAQMALGTLFILICYHLLSLCGASPALVIVLRVLYCVWYFFTIIFMLQYAMLLLKARAVLYDKINPKNELDD